MSFYDFALDSGLITGFGWAFGIDLLFWSWAVVTFLAFLNLFIPDPLPFVDEVILFLISVGLLLLMAFRGLVGFFDGIYGIATNPAVVGFLVTITALYVGGRIRDKQVKKK